MQEMSISELKVRLQGVVDRLSQLLDRVTEKTELGVFLIEICRVSPSSCCSLLELINSSSGFPAGHEGELGEGDHDHHR